MMLDESMSNVGSRASALVNSLRFSDPPVDLFRVAQLRRVKAIKLRSMVPRGGLVPVENGFEIYIRDYRSQDLPVDEPEPRGLFTHTQRFSFAHEIAHTLFYTLTAKLPSVRTRAPGGPDLEELCNVAASHILIPAELIRHELYRHGLTEISIEVVQHVASKFNVSLTVALKRLSKITSFGADNRGVILGIRSGHDAEIKASYLGSGLLRTLSRPAKFPLLRQWLPDIPSYVIDERGDSRWEIKKVGWTLHFRKVEIGPGPTFLLDVCQTAA